MPAIAPVASTFAGCEFSIFKHPVEGRVPPRHDFPVFPEEVVRAVAPPIIKHLEGLTERIDLVMAVPAALFPQQAHAFPQGLVGIGRNLGIDIRRDVLEFPGQQFLIHPDPAVDRIVPVIDRPCGQPRGMGEQSGTLLRKAFQRVARSASSTCAAVHDRYREDCRERCRSDPRCRVIDS